MSRAHNKTTRTTNPPPARAGSSSATTPTALAMSEPELFGESTGTVHSALRTFVLFKAFDLISDGEYKKLVVRSKDNGDMWADKVYSQVHLVNNLVRKLVSEIQTLDDYGKSRLRRVCTEIMAAVTPPARRRPGWSLCSITGLRSDECIDLTRVGKSTSVVTVHRRFSHFVLMLWYVVKFEHMCKVMARHWLSYHHSNQSASAAAQQQQEDEVEDHDDEAEDSKTPSSDLLSPARQKESHFVSSMCADFQQQQDAVINAMATGFRHAFLHSMRSIRAHKEAPDAEVLCTTTTATTIADAAPAAASPAAEEPPGKSSSSKRARHRK